MRNPFSRKRKLAGATSEGQPGMTPETIDLDGSIVEISAAIDPRTGERLIAIDRELLSDKAQAWAFEHAGATGEDVTDGLVEIYNDPRNWMGPDDWDSRPATNIQFYAVDEDWSIIGLRESLERRGSVEPSG